MHWRGSVQQPAHQTENIELIAGHIGLDLNPSVIFTIADRLALIEGDWQAFRVTGMARAFFSRTRLH